MAGCSATRCRIDDLGEHLAAQRTVGVPYTDAMIENATNDAYGQASPDSNAAAGVTERYGEATQVRAFDGDPSLLTEMDAVVAYLQILGRLTDAAHRQVRLGGGVGRWKSTISPSWASPRAGGSST